VICPSGTRKRPLFRKKRRKNFFECGPQAPDLPTLMIQIQKSLFASFSSEKEVLAITIS
jgi:hypothetical protein